MNARDSRRFTRAQNTVTFLINNKADYAASGLVAGLLGQIQASVQLISTAVAGQDPNRIKKRTLLLALQEGMKFISGTARSIELHTKDIGFAVPFNSVPNLVEEDLRTYADHLLSLLEDNSAPVDKGGDTPAQKTAKAALRQRFLDYLINPNFVTTLRRDRNQLDQIHQHNTTEVQDGTVDTAIIGIELTKINDVVDILDPLMGNIYQHQPEKLHAWERASRIESDPKRGNKPDEGNGDTPPPEAPKS